MLKRCLALTAAALTALGTGAFAQTAGEELDLSGVTLTVGTAGPRFGASWEFSAPETPYTVEFAPFDGSAPIVEAVVAGGVDIGLPGDIGVMFAHAAGQEVDIVGFQKGNPDFLRLIAPQGSEFETLEDLIGKTIAVTRGTSSHMFILKAVAAAGYTPDDLEWAFLSNADAGAAFLRNEVDAWATWDPFAATAELKWDAELVIHATPETVGSVYWIAKPDFFDGDELKAAAARDFIARFVAVNQAELDDRPGWAKTLGATMRLDDEVAMQVAEHYYFTTMPLDDVAVEDYKASVALLHEQGLISEIPEPADHFDFESVNEAVEAAISDLNG